MSLVAKTWKNFPPHLLDAMAVIAISLAANLLFSFHETQWPACIDWILVICLATGGVTLSLGAQEISGLIANIRHATPGITDAKFRSDLAKGLADPSKNHVMMLGLATMVTWLFAIAVVAGYYLYRTLAS